jgi:hypothetical protein
LACGENFRSMVNGNPMVKIERKRFLNIRAISLRTHVLDMTKITFPVMISSDDKTFFYFFTRYRKISISVWQAQRSGSCERRPVVEMH